MVLFSDSLGRPDCDFLLLKTMASRDSQVSAEVKIEIDVVKDLSSAWGPLHTTAGITFTVQYFSEVAIKSDMALLPNDQ